MQPQDVKTKKISELPQKTDPSWAAAVLVVDDNGIGVPENYQVPLSSLPIPDGIQAQVDEKADQADVYTKAEVDASLTGKSPTSHVHAISDVTGLQTALDGKSAAGHTHTAANVTDFDTEVSNNTGVAANTAARHTHANSAVLNATTASFTTADETKLDGIAAGAQVNTVTSVNTRTGAVTGLAEASDLTAHTGNTSNPHSVTKAQVGLGNVDNTADSAKPISTATQTALDGKFTQRTITGTTNQITVTNGDGVSGNPTLSLPQDIHTGASPTFAGVTLNSTLNMNDGRIDIPADNYTISDPPIKFIYPDMTDNEDSKGAIIEWGGVMDGASHPYGIATHAYQQNPAATFTAPSGYKKWAWVTAHYDSPLSTGEDVHQHLNLETVKADWLTAITRLQISFGEDIALVSFPNSHVKVYPDKLFQIGSDADGTYIEHDTADARINITGGTPWSFATAKVKIGTAGAPASRLHVEEATDAVALTIRNTLGSANGAPMILIENGTAGATAIQSGLMAEGTKRYSMNTSGRMEWGSGAASRDTNLYRNAANELKTDDKFISAGINVGASSTPASATASGIAGDIKWDASYIYVCTATNTWKRVGIATW